MTDPTPWEDCWCGDSLEQALPELCRVDLERAVNRAVLRIPRHRRDAADGLSREVQHRLVHDPGIRAIEAAWTLGGQEALLHLALERVRELVPPSVVDP